MTRILLVEGDDADAGRMRETLRLRPEWQLVRAATLREAARALRAERFDAAVLDADLPDGSGLEILDLLRVRSPGIRILLVAARESAAVALHALSRGAGDVLAKDRRLERELDERLHSLLGSPSALVRISERPFTYPE